MSDLQWPAQAGSEEEHTDNEEGQVAPGMRKRLLSLPAEVERKLGNDCRKCKNVERDDLRSNT